jgi:DNA-binding PadR family transcriptional regulator
MASSSRSRRRRASEPARADAGRAPAAEPVPRLSRTEQLILELLTERGELYGLQLVQRSEGRLPRGTVYVTLQRMEDKGLVASRLEEREDPLPGLPRRLYTPTRAGASLLRALELAAAAYLAAELGS